MKVFFKYVMAVLAFSAMVLSSCTKEEAPQEEKSNDVSIKSLVAYCPSVDREIDELTSALNTSTSTITLTTASVFSNETPVDLTNVKINLTLAKGATSDLKESYNLSEGNTDKLVITAEDGETKAEWTLVAVRADDLLVYPSSVTASVEDVWIKTTNEMGLKFPIWGSRGMDSYRESSGSYLYILDNYLPHSADNHIKIFNALNGEYIKDITEYAGGDAGCRSYMWGLKCDEAGHVAITRHNADGAGFFLDLYDNAENEWKFLGVPAVFFPDYETLTYFAGKKIQILGNLVNGEGLVLATCAHFYGAMPIYAEYNTFVFTNGVVSESIIQSTYPASAPIEWWSGEIQQESLTDQTIYATIVDEYNFGGDTPESEWPSLHAASFEIYDPVEGSTVSVDESCFNYRIIASEVFNCGSGKYLYTLEQSYSPLAPYVERLYFISNKELLENVTAESEDFNKFLLWESEPDDIGGATEGVDTRFGSVSVLLDESGTSAMLYCYHANNSGNFAKVCARRVTFAETFE